jgi:lipoprotein-releasing system ATP-binding protein
MNNEPLLRVNDLHKSFRKGTDSIEVLRGVSLEAHKAEGIAVVGSSGSGKSTMLHLLGGLEKPDRGEILYGEQKISAMNERDIALFRNRRIGFVFQFHYLLSEFTALENVMIPALLTEKMSPELRKRAEDLLDLVGLSNRMPHKPGEMSGGEQQRVAIARALMMSPEVLLADEPTGDLDPETGQKIIELFLDLRKTFSVTMITATHNMDLARVMDRVYVLKGGQLEPYPV